MSAFTQVTLYTDAQGRARFREQSIPLGEGTPQSMLSAVFPSSGYQLRESPVGFRSQFHCTGKAQWVFILRGMMEIGLQDGSTRRFGPENIFSPPTCCPRARCSIPRCTATAAGRWATRRW